MAWWHDLQTSIPLREPLWYTIGKRGIIGDEFLDAVENEWRFQMD